MTREEQFKEMFPLQPAWRLKQLQDAFFDVEVHGFDEVSTLSKPLRERLSESMPWMSVRSVGEYASKGGDATKFVFELDDGLQIETVLMKNSRGSWTACLSSQVGCGMKCVFCATGKMGFKRDLTSDEIVDQLRYLRQELADNESLGGGRLSNFVIMGMGEPLANYNNVKTALNQILAGTDIGPTRITVSTVGILPRLEEILTDPEWPPVRMAISLHSADEDVRKDIMPSTAPGFLAKLADWADRYAAVGSQRQRLTLEYILLDNKNDRAEDAKKLAKFVRRAGEPKVNIIPYNRVPGAKVNAALKEKRQAFRDILIKEGVDVTERRSLGNDIQAACGQLALEQEKK